MDEVVVTALSIASGFGVDLEAFSEKMFKGASATENIRNKVVPENFPVPHGAMIPRSLLQFGRDPYISLVSKLFEKILPDLNGLKIDGIVYGSPEGISFSQVKKAYQAIASSDEIQVDDWRSEHSLNYLKFLLENKTKSKIEPRNLVCLNNACATGNIAIGIGMERVKSGHWERAIVGAVDLRLDQFTLMSHFLLGSLNTREMPSHLASCPFS